MKGKLLLLAIGAPLAFFSAWSGVVLVKMLAAAYEVRDWSPVQAQLAEGGYRRESRVRGSAVHIPFATYHYEIDGRVYQGRQVGISRGTDSLGDYQRELGLRLERASQQGDTITVYVNPRDPSVSVYEPTLRWGLAGAMLGACVVFGALGASFLVGAYRR